MASTADGELESRRPNVVLIVCDQFRGDCLGVAGHPDVKTPYLDTLAAQGTFFENGYSACPSCIPARASLLTGKAPRSTGRVGYQDGIPWNYDHMMAEEFSAAGYQTAMVGKMHVHPPRLGCGFQHYRLHDGYIGHYRKANKPHWMHQDVSDDYLRFLRSELGPEADVNGTGVENNSWIARPWVYEERLHPTNWVVDESIRFIETRDRTRPFFLMASFVRPHPPFDAPAAYYQPYLDRELREPARGDWDDVEATERDGMIIDSPHGCRDATLRHEAMAGYYGCITHIDHQIGRLITTLENDETYENTVVLFTADHGEMLFDHSSFRKVLPYEGSTHVPFIVRVGSRVLPEGKPAPRRSEAVVDLMDVIAHAARPRGRARSGGRGRLLPQGRDHGREEPRPRVPPRRALRQPTSSPTSTSSRSTTSTSGSRRPASSATSTSTRTRARSTTSPTTRPVPSAWPSSVPYS